MPSSSSVLLDQEQEQEQELEWPFINASKLQRQPIRLPKNIATISMPCVWSSPLKTI